MKYVLASIIVATVQGVAYAQEPPLRITRDVFWKEHAVIYAHVAESYGTLTLRSQCAADLEVLGTLAGTMDASLMGDTVRTEPGRDLIGLTKGDYVLALVRRTETGKLELTGGIDGIFPSKGLFEVVSGLNDPAARTVLANLRKLRATEAAERASRPASWLPVEIVLPIDPKAELLPISEEIKGSADRLGDGQVRIKFTSDTWRSFYPEYQPWLRCPCDFTLLARDGDYVPVFGSIFRVRSATLLSYVNPNELPEGVQIERHSIVFRRGGTFQLFDNGSFTGMVKDEQGNWKGRIELPANEKHPYVKHDMEVGQEVRMAHGEWWRVKNIVAPAPEKHIPGWIEFVRSKAIQ